MSTRRRGKNAKPRVVVAPKPPGLSVSSASSSSSFNSSAAGDPMEPVSVSVSPLSSIARRGAATMPKPRADWSSNKEWENYLVQLLIDRTTKLQQRGQMGELWREVEGEMVKRFPDLPFTYEQIRTKWRTIFEKYIKDAKMMQVNPRIRPASKWFKQLHPLWKDDVIFNTGAGGSAMPTKQVEKEMETEDEKEEKIVITEVDREEKVNCIPNYSKNFSGEKLDEMNVDDDVILNDSPPRPLSGVSGDSDSSDVTMRDLTRSPLEKTRFKPPTAAKSADKLFDAVNALSSGMNELITMRMEMAVREKEQMEINKRLMQVQVDREERERAHEERERAKEERERRREEEGKEMRDVVLQTKRMEMERTKMRLETERVQFNALMDSRREQLEAEAVRAEQLLNQ